MKKYNIKMVSLGCAKNRVDAEEMLGLLKANGHNIVSAEGAADIAIVNTCGFIESAKQESINEILSLADEKAKGKIKYIIVAGCLAQRYADELAKEIPEADAFIGVTAFEDICSVVDDLENGEKMYMKDVNLPCRGNFPRITDDALPYAYLKIAEGCDNRCSYCAIPYIRGRFRSKPFEDVISEAKRLALRGKKELIVVAQDITRYGQDTEGQNLVSLLRALSQIDGFEWIRMMYLNPARVTKKFVDEVANIPKVLMYFDIPIQHISAKMLKSMNREASAQHVREIFVYIREKIPNAILRTTLISGFPGEEDNDFEDMARFVESAEADHLGVFTFSPEEGTPAVSMADQVGEDIANNRADRLMSIQKKIAVRRLRARVGKTIDVLIEGGAGDGMFVGRSMREAPDIDGAVYVESEEELCVGEIVKAKVTKVFDLDTVAEKV